MASMLLLEKSHVGSVTALFPMKLNVGDLADFMETLWDKPTQIIFLFTEK